MATSLTKTSLILIPQVHGNSQRLSEWQKEELTINKTTINWRYAWLVSSSIKQTDKRSICWLFQIDPDDIVVYTNLIRKFLVTLITSNKCFIILYYYNTNVILAKTISSKSDDEALQVYEKLNTYLKQHRFTVSLNVIDSEASIVVNNKLNAPAHPSN